MTPARWANLTAVLVLLVVAVAFGITRLSGPGSDDPAITAEVRDLQARAGLTACPTALAADLPHVTLTCLGDGARVAVKGTPPGPMLVNVWGTWCTPCLAEVPLLTAFSAEAAGKVAVVGVLTEDTMSSALSYADHVDMRYPSVVDTKGRISARFGTGVPKTLFVDAQGTITFVERGQITSREELHQLVAEHLGVTL
jgi:thiol-disulfide isomerase/thioredoxin